MIQFPCPHCSAILKYSGSRSGIVRIKCPKCQKPVEVPITGSTQRRFSNRRMSSPMSVLVSDAEAQAEPVEATILNRSKGGICLALNRSVDRGTILSVRLAVPLEEVPWVQVKVKYCGILGPRWKVGCQFVEDLPEDVLLLFG